MAGRGECSFEVLNRLNGANTGQTAQALLLQLFLLALPRQTGNWGIGCWTTVCVTGVKKRGGSKQTRGCGCQKALLCDNHSLGCTLHPKGVRKPKKATDWGPLCTKVDISFTLMHREKLSMTLLCSCTACSKVQTSWETRRSFHPANSQHIWGRADP